MITTQIQRGRLAVLPVNQGLQTARPAATVQVTLVSKGVKGDPGIHISATPPVNPQVNDLWIQLPIV